MARKDVEVGIRLKADGQNMIGSMRLSRTELKKLQGAMRDTDRRVQESSRSFEGWGAKLTSVKGLLAGLGLTLGAAQITQYASAQLAAAEDIGRTAEALGITTDAVQELNYAFGRFKASPEDVSDALNTLADRAQDAIAGSQSMIDDFALLGITVDDLRGKRPDELFDLFAKAVQGTSNVQERNAAVVRNLGDDLGRKLLPMLVATEGGYADLRREAQDLGLILNEDVIANAGRIREEFDKAQRIIGVQFMNALNQATPLIITMADQLGRAARLWADILDLDPTENLREQMQGLATERDRLMRVLETGRAPHGGRVSEQFLANAAQRVRELNEQLVEMGNRLVELEEGGRGGSSEPIDIGTVTVNGTGGLSDDELERLREQTEKRLGIIRESLMSERELELARYEEKKEFLEQADAEFFESEAERQELLEELHREHQDRLTAIDREAVQERVALEQAAQSQMQALRQQTQNLAIGLLQTFGREHKAMAYASIAITKGMAIAQTLAHTKTAAMLAYASQLVPGDITSPVRAAAAYAKTMAMGQLNAALIAATGLAEAYSVSQQGSTPGSPSNPVYTTPSNQTPQPQQPASAEPATQRIYLEIVGGDDQRVPLRELRQQIRRIKEENPDAEVVF